jgi:hypothetical protein
MFVILSEAKDLFAGAIPAAEDVKRSPFSGAEIVQKP